jgi:hypothetical protein
LTAPRRARGKASPAAEEGGANVGAGVPVLIGLFVLLAAGSGGGARSAAAKAPAAPTFVPTATPFAPFASPTAAPAASEAPPPPPPSETAAPAPPPLESAAPTPLLESAAPTPPPESAAPAAPPLESAEPAPPATAAAPPPTATPKMGPPCPALAAVLARTGGFEFPGEACPAGAPDPSTLHARGWASVLLNGEGKDSLCQHEYALAVPACGSAFSWPAEPVARLDVGLSEAGTAAFKGWRKAPLQAAARHVAAGAASEAPPLKAWWEQAGAALCEMVNNQEDGNMYPASFLEPFAGLKRAFPKGEKRPPP